MGEKPDSNHRASGSWDKEPAAVTINADNKSDPHIYTYTYADLNTFTITVKYQDLDGKQLMDDFTQDINKGGSYDVSNCIYTELGGNSVYKANDSRHYVKIDLTGDETSGGNVTNDVEIIVIYALDEIGNETLDKGQGCGIMELPQMSRQPERSAT